MCDSDVIYTGNYDSDCYDVTDVMYDSDVFSFESSDDRACDDVERSDEEVGGNMDENDWRPLYIPDVEDLQLP